MLLSEDDIAQFLDYQCYPAGCNIYLKGSLLWLNFVLVYLICAVPHPNICQVLNSVQRCASYGSDSPYHSEPILPHVPSRGLLTRKSRAISETFWSFELRRVKPSVGEQSAEPHFGPFVVSSVHQLLLSLQDSLAKQQKDTFSGGVSVVSGADYKLWKMDN